MDTPTLSPKRTLFPVIYISLFFLMVFAGCKNETGLSEVELPPSVTVTYPAHNATDIPINTSISALFNEEMDPATITDTTFTLQMDTLVIEGSINYADSTATFTPSNDLEFDRTYKATITTHAQNLSGNGMDEDYEWLFTTVSEQNEPDTSPPQIESTTPSDNATEVSINTAVIATFNEPVNASTINEATFSVAQGGNPISANVSYANNTATLTPLNSLDFGETYTATLSPTVEDTAGNALEEAYTWSFTTANQPDNTAPQINTIDPEEDEDNVAITVNIVVTFDEPINSASVTSSSFFLEQGNTPVPGSYSFSGNSIIFEPNNNLAFDETYTATVTTDIEDMSGNNLASAVEWSFTTSPQPDNEAPEINFFEPGNGDDNVPINTNITLIFSEAVNESTINLSTILLEEGNDQIGGNFTINDNEVTFNPNSNLEYETDYTVTVTTGVEDQAGNSLENNFEWEFETEDEPDDDDPEIDSTEPQNNASDIPVDIGEITATFNEPMNSATFDETSFTVSQNGTPVAGTVPNFNGATASFIPGAELDFNTTYTATITTGVQDLAGNNLGSTYVWNFTTEQETEPPSLVSTNPEDTAIDIPLDTPISATFSEALDPATVNAINVTLIQDGATPVLGQVANSEDPAVITFTPLTELSPGSTYTASISTNVQDLAGNALTDPVSWSFTTTLADSLDE